MHAHDTLHTIHYTLHTTHDTRCTHTRHYIFSSRTAAIYATYLPSLHCTSGVTFLPATYPTRIIRITLIIRITCYVPSLDSESGVTAVCHRVLAYDMPRCNQCVETVGVDGTLVLTAWR
jgi:hypothetical protein